MSAAPFVGQRRFGFELDADQQLEPLVAPPVHAHRNSDDDAAVHDDDNKTGHHTDDPDLYPKRSAWRLR